MLKILALTAAGAAAVGSSSGVMAAQFSPEETGDAVRGGVVNAPPAPPTYCGHYPAALSTTQPNVLLVGDSISMPTPPSPGGYGDNTQKILERASVNVWHNGGWDIGGQVRTVDTMN